MDCRLQCHLALLSMLFVTILSNQLHVQYYHTMNLNQEAQFQLYQIRYFQICFELVKLLVFIYLSKYLRKAMYY